MAIIEPARPALVGATVAARPTAPEWLRRIHPLTAIVAVVLLFMPAIANDFWLFQIFSWSYILGVIALSLMFLAGYGGMVSLMQMTVAGVAGYTCAMFGVSTSDGVNIGWPWWLAAPVGLAAGTAFGTLAGALAVRTEGIYTIVITLAIAAAFFYLANENYAIFNGHTGINAIASPHLFGVDWRSPIPFYYLTLAVAAACYFGVVYLSRAPFGLALQGVRDNPRRMHALGFNVRAHRIAAYAFASFVAGLGGVLLVWQNTEIAPSTAGVDTAIDILIIAIVGGITRPIGPFIGALTYAILKAFALDFLVAVGLNGARFRMLIGLGFLAIVFFSPDGFVGLWNHLRERSRAAGGLSGGAGSRHG
ncbi:MAG: branched-chain amino acid ABC transporter permease [Roseiarcus sp.]